MEFNWNCKTLFGEFGKSLKTLLFTVYVGGLPTLYQAMLGAGEPVAEQVRTTCPPSRPSTRTGGSTLSRTCSQWDCTTSPPETCCLKINLKLIYSSKDQAADNGSTPAAALKVRMTDLYIHGRTIVGHG